MCQFYSSWRRVWYLIKYPSTQSPTLQLGHHHCILVFHFFLFPSGIFYEKCLSMILVTCLWPCLATLTCWFVLSFLKSPNMRQVQPETLTKNSNFIPPANNVKICKWTYHDLFIHHSSVKLLWLDILTKKNNIVALQG